MAAHKNNVWIGAETGILKGVNLDEKTASNYSNVASLSKDEEITAICWANEQQTQVCIGQRNHIVKTFDVELGDYIRENDCTGGEGTFQGIANVDNHLITCTQSGLLKIWKEEPEECTEIDVGKDISRMRINPENKNLVSTGGKENDLKIWDLENSKVPVFKAKNVRNDFLDLRVPVWVCDMQFIPGSSKIVSCSRHHCVRVYDPSTPQRRPVLNIEFDEYPVMALSLIPNTNYVIVGNSQGRMGKIDLRKGLVHKIFKGFAGSIRDIECHQTEPLVASCGLDRHLRIHNVHTSVLEHKVYLKSRLNCLLFSSKDLCRMEETEDTNKKRKAESGDNSCSEDDDIWNKMDVISDKTQIKDKDKRKRVS
ncbi:WD repeat-containing protein 74-like [Saccoglossus kowalevskii]|uniref:WD repeat-containing protein 74-like n=1 Tax=Saccoglossus kowalevskii TaxID=10224 RepID=A0ABM0GKR3_SACKO|nr:PREDICTED: WD repeat-containing protein 74-like [Saccoglossus kowalevskii]